MPIFIKTPRPAIWESLSLRLQKNRRRSMPEPVDLDAGQRLGGHGARARRRLMAHCQLKPVHEPALSPTTASSSASDRGSDVSSARHPGPGQRRRAGIRGPPRESRATWAPQREVSTVSSQHHLVRGERECKARTNHRLSGWPAPVWRRGAKRTGHGTQSARPRRPRHRHAHRTLPATHRPDRPGGAGSTARIPIPRGPNGPTSTARCDPIGGSR